MLDPVQSACVDALRMLARRELSEAQVRQRLARRGHGASAIDAAVTRLRQERAIDDARVAEAIARTDVTLRRRGKVRIRRDIENAGIAASTARRVVDGLFSEIDANELLEASLARRLRGRWSVSDEAEFGRLYRYLIGQGFEADRVLEALNRRRARHE
jgi:regulatory protein